MPAALKMSAYTLALGTIPYGSGKTAAVLSVGDEIPVGVIGDDEVDSLVDRKVIVLTADFARTTAAGGADVAALRAAVTEANGRADAEKLRADEAEKNLAAAQAILADPKVAPVVAALTPAKT